MSDGFCNNEESEHIFKQAISHNVILLNTPFGFVYKFYQAYLRM